MKTCAVDYVFYIRAFRGRGNIDRFRARNQGHDKRGEIWMSVITCGSIHEGHEWFSDDSQGRQEIF